MQEFNENAFRLDVYALLARLFRGAPDSQVLDWLACLDVNAPVIPQQNMAASWPLIKLAAQQSNSTRVADEYQCLFIGVGRGELVPFGSWYLTGSLMEMPLAHLRRDLLELGFERETNVKEPEDHISALLEVMMMLAQSGDEKLQQRFFNRHLSPWFVQFCRDLKQAKNAVFYAAIGELALQFLTVEQIRFIETK